MSSTVTIVVPVYNTGKFLHRCVDSIINQTYTNTEIILVDDGSEDNSPEICDDYARQDTRIKVIHKKNGGLSMARNTGIDEAKGEYICFIDSDDYIHPEFIDTLYHMCINYNADIAQCGIIKTKNDDFIDDKKIFTVKTFDNMEMIERIYKKNYSENIVAWNKLYLLKLFSDVRYPEGIMREDEATTYKLFYNANKIAVTEKGYYYYFSNPESFTRCKYTVKQLDILRAMEIRLDFYRRKGLKKFYDKDCFLYLTRILINYYKVVKYLDDSKKYKTELKEKYKEIYNSADKKEWSIGRKILLRFCRTFPLFYGAVYMKIKSYIFDRKLINNKTGFSD